MQSSPAGLHTKAAGLSEILHCTFSMTPILNTQMFQTAKVFSFAQDT